MRSVGQFPRRVEEIENQWITLADGCRLAARIWLPADDDPVPAILEFLPYRKRDGTTPRDALTHPYIAGHGYACLRVDMRGNGESDGLMDDEYTKQEHDDAIETIAWIAAQPWCTGKVGMIGISWGGFNALQVAARRPAALKAIVTICSTDDRYADDIHYMGGALLNENLGWASTMLSYSSRPPDPALVGERWRDMWLNRLDNMPLLIETWLGHQRRDDYWKHGSVCEDYGAIKAAVFAVGGWADAYSNAVPRLLAGLTAPAKGLVGPWLHKYPHFATPQPAIGFLQECLRWWDHWLKGLDTGVMDDPRYTAWMQDSVPPQAAYPERPGRWIAEPAWPSAKIETLFLALNHDGLAPQAGAETALTLCSPQTTGVASGVFCAMWLGPDMPTDQRPDDAGSLVFDTPPLDDRMEIFGAVVAELDVAIDRPQGFLAVRLCDVAPSGASTRVTVGILNLSHRDSHEHPAAVEPGTRYRVRVQLNDIAHAFPAGHRIRLAVSTAYWPLIWPSPEAVTLTLHCGVSGLALPIREPRHETLRPFEEAEGAPPLNTEEIRPASKSRTVEWDVASGRQVLRTVNDFGEQRITEHGLVGGEIARETFTIDPDDPLSARMETHWTETFGRGDWSLRIETRTTLTADLEAFFIQSEIEAFEGDERIYHRDWDRSIPRDMV
ncbi:MAG: CocE/NonD family hydrolase [Alphaproteobacteria bacterium]